MRENRDQQHFLIAYESIGLDVGEGLKGRLSIIRRVIAQTRTTARQKQRVMVRAQ
jgi:hypothetical protein